MSMRGVRFLEVSEGSAGEAVAPRGSVTLYVGVDAKAALQEIEKSVVAGKRIHPKNLDEMVDAEATGKSTFTVRHGSRVLARHVPLPRPHRVVRLVMPYNGGRLFEDGLTATADESSEPLDALAVRHMPKLTDVEEAALHLVPESMLELNLGGAMGHIDGADENERDKAEGWADRQMERAMEKGGFGALIRHLRSTSVKDLDPGATAAALVHARRNILRG